MKERIISWLRDNFETDYGENNFGLDALFPNILICCYYDTKKGLKDGMFSCLGESEEVKKTWDWLNRVLEDDHDDSGDMILSYEIWSLEELLERFEKDVEI